MSSDFVESLKKFAQASIGERLPLEQMDEDAAARRERRLGRRVSRAARANLTHRARGRLVFSSTLGSATPRPIAYMKVQLWDRDLGSPDDFLGEAMSDADGRFEIRYDPADAGSFDAPDLEVRIIDHFRDQEQVIFVAEGGDDVVDATYEFGDVGVPWYEYHPSIPLPHILTFNYGKQTYDAMPQSYPPGRRLAMARVAAPILGVRLKHYTVDRKTSLEEIQRDYRGLTDYAAPNGPGPDATADARFVYKLLNGNCPCLFTTTADRLLHVVREWDRYEFDGEHHLPNVHAVFSLEGDRLVPRSITVAERVGNAREPGSPLGPPATYRPGEPGWSDAIHALETTNYMYTQAANHLARGHFNVEQMALAAWRNLRLSPLAELLMPHLREVMIINVEGERAIFGPDGLITKNGALTERSLVEAIVDQASIDWRGWRPRAPMTADHDFARVANIIWEALGEHVDVFFAAHMDEILATWGEARGLSDELAAHSVAYRPLPLPAGHRHFDLGEVAADDAPRIEADGQVRTMSPIITAERPSPEELAALAAWCRYAIFHATFWHGWINDTSDSLEPSYSQYNPVEHSSPKELTDHISLNLVLSQTRYGLVMRNEDGDIPRSLLDALAKRAEALRALGYDLRRLRSRINI